MKIFRYHRHKTKVKKNNKTYVYHNIARLFYKQGKTHREIVQRFGRQDEEGVRKIDQMVEYYNFIEQLRDDGDSIDRIGFDQYPLLIKLAPSYLIPACGFELWKEWELDVFFNHHNRCTGGKLSTTNVICAASLLRLDGHKSGVDLCEEVQQSALPIILETNLESLNRTRLSRELIHIANLRKALAKHMYEVMIRKGWSKGSHNFIDTSSWNLHGITCTLGHFGKCKDGFGNHFIFMLAIVPEGFTNYWEILPGNSADTAVFNNFVENTIDSLGIDPTKVCFTFDRGFVSDDNLSRLEEKGIRYVSALDSPQLKYFERFLSKSKMHSIMDHYIERRKDGTVMALSLVKEEVAKIGFRPTNAGKTFYKKVEFSKKDLIYLDINVTTIDPDRQYYVAISPENVALKRFSRCEMIKKIKQDIQTENATLAAAKRSRVAESVEKKANGIADKRGLEFTYYLHDLECNYRGKKVKSFQIEFADAEVSNPSDGYWIAVTNCVNDEDLCYSFDSVVDAYGAKVRVEEAIRILSNVVELEPIQRVSKETIEGLINLCIISQNIDTLMLERLRSHPTTKGIGLDRLFRVLDRCRVADVVIAARLKHILTCPSKEQNILTHAIGAGQALALKTLQSKGIEKPMLSD